MDSVSDSAPANDARRAELRALRASLGDSLSAAGRRMHADKSAVHRWEKGLRPVPMAELALYRIKARRILARRKRLTSGTVASDSRGATE
jgi:hypothetical protein